MASKNSTIIPEEVEKFSNLAFDWWNPDGKFKPLHKLNPARVLFVREISCQILGINPKLKQPLKNLNILDIGCGGGIMSESMSKLGANVTGLDASEKNIKIAKYHSQESNLNINYLHQDIEDFAEKNGNKFDIILNLEAIEHVANPDNFIAASAKCLKNDGLMFISTINRNPKSFLMAIIGAEYLLRWLPIGTHDWKKFFKPSEILQMAQDNNLNFIKSKGFEFNILKNSWYLSDNLDVNYISCFSKV